MSWPGIEYSGDSRGLAFELEAPEELETPTMLCRVPEGADESLLASSTGLGNALGSGCSGII
jgi:hypothetical protein